MRRGRNEPVASGHTPMLAHSPGWTGVDIEHDHGHVGCVIAPDVLRPRGHALIRRGSSPVFGTPRYAAFLKAITVAGRGSRHDRDAGRGPRVPVVALRLTEARSLSRPRRGPNASGKSTFLDILAFLGDLQRAGLRQAITGNAQLGIPLRAADPRHASSQSSEPLRCLSPRRLEPASRHRRGSYGRAPNGTRTGYGTSARRCRTSSALR